MYSGPLRPKDVIIVFVLLKVVCSRQGRIVAALDGVTGNARFDDDGKQLAQYLVILLLVIKHLRWYKILKLSKIPKGLIECICNTF